MQKIVRIRPLMLREAPLARALKPFEDVGLVVDIYDEIDKFEFVVDITNDRAIDSPNFSHVMMKTHAKMTPKELYQHMVDADSYVSPLYIVNETKDKKYKSIYAVKKYSDIQRFVHTMNSKGIIDGQYLVKGPEERLYES